ncbi:hypothetical protein, partial [Pseudescherichia vulneris]|uniref:hypothetical protein n=1 Tax=Pseudescherichia vulneris TaxID=566 RepID=UPI001ABEF8DF
RHTVRSGIVIFFIMLHPNSLINGSLMRDRRGAVPHSRSGLYKVYVLAGKLTAIVSAAVVQKFTAMLIDQA